MKFSIDLNENFIGIPRITQISLFIPKPLPIAWAKLLAPLPNRLVGNDNAALC
jgi:hypothetical protein